MVKRRFESIYNDIGLRDNDTGKEYVYFNKDCVDLINGLSEENTRTYNIIGKHISYFEELRELKGVDKDSITQRINALMDLRDDLLCEKWKSIPKPEFKPAYCRCVYNPIQRGRKE